ncbi:amino acid adenylation domain-containing protein [Anabaena subtropica FACHB-260]|uniref:Amino acid adenylation domain-containing protein n=1 Tax=Anabaena subtropica FACHB-260 TaxID=2692884 RepID=A0ABR8CQ43_9NOST|nr:non-ribosomal peptide synthetase [Anabaena subtropica]MBD2344921.1 amino acid adenylation domain-containing protein [Anabaena subtropica FACHB-260]
MRDNNSTTSALSLHPLILAKVLFVNTLVLRTDFTGNPTFRELLRRVREKTLEAYAHQDIPFDLLVEELQPQRNLSHAPLFQVMFILQNTPMSALELSGLTLNFRENNANTAMFDLTLDMKETEGGLVGTLEYNTDLFDDTTITRMVEHLQTLFKGIVTNPEQRLSELPLLTESERHKVLVEWNETQVEYPQDKCLHHLFEAQVDKTPNAVAVVFVDEQSAASRRVDQQLTYRELNTKANQLAHYLQTLGVKPEVLVGICVERSLDMVVGILAILKAGGAYIPLDPNYPEERLAFILSDSQLPILLTQQHLKQKLPQHETQIVCLDTNQALISQQSQDNPIVSLAAENVAYVIYTSGSTGQPKGVFGLHKGAINRFQWMWQNYPFGEQEICCQKTSLNFVDSVWEIFGPLLQGVTLVIIPNRVVKDPQQFIAVLAENNITRLVVVPSLLAVMLSTANLLQLQLPKLKLWISSGEALSHELLGQFRQSLPDSTLLNLYGSSEVSADVTCYSITPQTPLSASVLIGRPIANTQIYILDTNKQPVPVGLPGEIYVGGEQLARGYLNLPQLTAEKFLSNPFSNKPTSRLYKTGDLARYLPTGEIEYIGRIDHQVKIRGFRVETGEIEAKITQYPDVQEAVVVLREDVSGNKQLVAYVVSEQELKISELRNFLQEKIPDYMIPAAFVSMKALPLTPNGKVDRRSLPIPDNLRPQLETTYIKPQNDLEASIAMVWQKALKIEKVGINDNFFELGGHSLLVVQVHSQLREILQKDLLILDLFRYPTISSLAEFLNQTNEHKLSEIHSNKARTQQLEAGKIRMKQFLKISKGVR